MSAADRSQIGIRYGGQNTVVRYGGQMRVRSVTVFMLSGVPDFLFFPAAFAYFFGFFLVCFRFLLGLFTGMSDKRQIGIREVSDKFQMSVRYTCQIRVRCESGMCRIGVR